MRNAVFNHRKKGTRFESFSSDNGNTWHGFQPVPSLIDPGCAFTSHSIHSSTIDNASRDLATSQSGVLLSLA
jgi:hypothetical protein